MKSAFDWLRSTSLKVAAGELRELKDPPGKDAKPEEIAAWRKENGIPEKATDYVTNLKLGEGVVPGEADKPLLEAVAGMALERGYKQDAVNDFVGLYYQLQDQMASQRVDQDGQFKAQTEQSLMRDMGPDFKPNMNALQAFWGNAPKGMADTILGARTADGRVVGDLPDVVNYFAGLARELDPAATILPGGSGDPKTVGSRISEIEGLMYKDSPPGSGKWGPHYTSALQEEYRQLVDAQSKLQQRGRAA